MKINSRKLTVQTYEQATRKAVASVAEALVWA